MGSANHVRFMDRSAAKARARTAPSSMRRAALALDHREETVGPGDARLTAPCLVVNSTYEPLQPLPTTHAIKLLLKGKAEVVTADEGRLVHAEHLTMHPPQIIRLTSYVNVPKHPRQTVTGRWLYAHFDYRCTYCGRHASELPPGESLTHDHVIPISRGGDDGWRNATAACRSCNKAKGSKTVEELGWTMRQQPSVPQFVHLGWKVRRLTPVQRQFIEAYYGERTSRAFAHLLDTPA
jgi:5-methylcytosine-specific restriction endonuclease McrA